MIPGYDRKRVIIIAGPNGAGKTTFARSFLPDEAGLPRFINADLIAEGLAPFAPESAAVRAGRLMLEELDRYTAAGESFAFETTLAGLGYLQRIRQWREQGYRVSLYFLRLPDADTAIARVAERVRQGGHNIPEPIIRRRFKAGLDNSTGTQWTTGHCTTTPALFRNLSSTRRLTDDICGHIQSQERRTARLSCCHAAGIRGSTADRDPDQHRHCRGERWQDGAHPRRRTAQGSGWQVIGV